MWVTTVWFFLFSCSHYQALNEFHGNEMWEILISIKAEMIAWKFITNTFSTVPFYTKFLKKKTIKEIKI